MANCPVCSKVRPVNNRLGDNFGKAMPCPEHTEQALADKIDEWHDSEETRPLHEYLGLTWSQYKAWVEGEAPNEKAAEKPVRD